MVAGEDGDTLPLVYDPDQIALFWSRRPVAVLTRIVQLLSIAGGFISGFLWDLANGRLAENEVGSLPLAAVPKPASGQGANASQARRCWLPAICTSLL